MDWYPHLNITEDTDVPVDAHQTVRQPIIGRYAAFDLDRLLCCRALEICKMRFFRSSVWTRLAEELQTNRMLKQHGHVAKQQ